MNVLITGGAGFIGTHLRRKLIESGDSVRILDNLLPQVHGDSPRTDFLGAEFILGDVRDADTVRRAVKGIDVVYHLAAETGVGQSQYEIERYISTNTLGTAVVLHAAVESNVGHFVITSSRAVYGEGVHVCLECEKQFLPKSRLRDNLDKGNWEIVCPDCGNVAEPQPMSEGDPFSPISIYGLTKVQQEQTGVQVRQVYEMPITNLRLFNVFGPGQSLTNPYVGVLGTFFRRVSSGKDIDIYEDGQMRRDFVYVGDVVEALRLTGRNERALDRTINVGSGNGVTLEDAGHEMFRLLGVEPKMNFSGKYRLGDIHHAVADTRCIAETLGYLPDTSFEAGLRKFVDWALSQDFEEINIDSLAESQLKEKNLLRQALS